MIADAGILTVHGMVLNVARGLQANTSSKKLPLLKKKKIANLANELKLHKISIQNTLEQDYLSEIGPRTQLVMELQVN